jgi:hypothetical protein
MSAVHCAKPLQPATRLPTRGDWRPLAVNPQRGRRADLARDQRPVAATLLRAQRAADARFGGQETESKNAMITKPM